MQRTTCLPIWILLVLATLGLPGLVLGDEPNRAGLVIQFSEDRVETRCVTFEGEATSGADLLAHSGLEAIVDSSSGMGITVCQIEGEGCAYPAQPCFCHCMGGGECAYWNYFFRDPGGSAWSYSALGAGLRKVKAGSVEGWVWGNGDTPPAEQVTFESICPPPTATPTDTPEPPPPTTVVALPTETLFPTQTPITLPTATVPPPSPVPTAAASVEPEMTSYWPFGLMVLGLTLTGLLVWLRRR